MKKLALAILSLGLMCGCHGNVTEPVVVTMNPSLPPSIDQGQTLQFSVTVQYDKSNSGVVWTATGTGCQGHSCGTFSNVTPTSATYVSPPSVTAALAITVTATSVAQSNQFALASFTVGPPPSVVTTNLPNATPNYIYNTELVGTGGTAPLVWSITHGSLPAGLSLNSAGLIYGTPTTGGTSTFTVKLTDSSGAASGPLSIEQTFTLTVSNVLTVPTASLPNGRIGIAYSAGLPINGGTPPYNWTIYTGTLPDGLTLQSNTGVISGTPTAQGTFSFEVEAFDSSTVQQYYISSYFSITIIGAGPLSISTSSLIDGTVGVPYAGQLATSGGTPPATWKLTSGALPTGLSLVPASGVITGTPTASPGVYTFQVQATDSSTLPETATQTLSLTLNSAAPTCSSTGNNSVLVGQYAFSLRGFNGTGFLDVLGSFTADGNGNITAGEADTNGVLGAASGNLIANLSSYSVGPDNRGCATLATPFGTFFTRFVVGDLSAGVATAGRIIEFDNPSTTAFIASGPLLQQSPSAFLFGLTGTYAVDTAGWDPTTSSRVACVGILNAAKFQFSSQQRVCNDGGTVSSSSNSNTVFTTSINTFRIADGNGRYTGSLSVGQGTSNMVFYGVLNNYVLFLNTDPSPTFGGELLSETVPVGSSGFNAGSWDATVAEYATGLGTSGSGGQASFAVETANGTNSSNFQFYNDIDGALQTSTRTCPYSIVFIGQLTFGGSCNTNSPIEYMTSVNNAIVLSTDSAVELGTFKPQTANLTTSSLAGSYFAGTSEIVNQSAQAEVGLFTLTTAGALTSTIDSTSTTNQSVGAAGSDTVTVNSNGTLSTASSSGATVGIAISPTNLVIVSNPTLTYPTLLFGQQ